MRKPPGLTPHAQTHSHHPVSLFLELCLNGSMMSSRKCSVSVDQDDRVAKVIDGFGLGTGNNRKRKALNYLG